MTHVSTGKKQSSMVVIRKKENRPETADHGRSKTRNQRRIDFLRSTGRIDGLPDDDQAAVRQLSRLLRRNCGELAPDMHIIAADHVQPLDDWFRASIAERWRDRIALVPWSWLRG